MNRPNLKLLLRGKRGERRMSAQECPGSTVLAPRPCLAGCGWMVPLSSAQRKRGAHRAAEGHHVCSCCSLGPGTAVKRGGLCPHNEEVRRCQEMDESQVCADVAFPFPRCPPHGCCYPQVRKDPPGSQTAKLNIPKGPDRVPAEDPTLPSCFHASKPPSDPSRCCLDLSQTQVLPVHAV